ncbi:MAG TPA: hypothetical protein VM869_23330, partial [Enhygromyxa sp.]|nr:hypothetical protein [Enhygromyxa sp.]
FPQGAPFGFPRFAQDSAGELAVVGVVEDDWATASWPQGIHRLAPLEAPQWAHDFGLDGEYSRFMDGLEVDSDDRLHVWTGLQSEVFWITRDANGVWIEQKDSASTVGGLRTLTIDGEHPVGFRYVATQLNAEIGGEKIPLGTPQGSQSDMIRVARRPKPSWGGIGPDYAVTTTHDTGTQIHWPGGELLLPEAAYMPELPCPPDHDPDVACEPSCSFDLSGVVEEQQQGTRGMLAVARTADGVLWIAWIESHFVLEYTYTQVCPGEPDPCECEPEVITDERSSRLRVLRYDFVGEPVEVLSMPFAADYDAPRPKIIADAFADRIVLSLIVEGLGPMQDQRGHRVLELDTDAL